MTLANMFRKKGRLILTQVVLIAAGTMFWIVVSLATSTDLTVTNDLNRRGYDVHVAFENEEQSDRLTRLAEQMGQIMLDINLDCAYSYEAAAIWLGVVLPIAGLTSVIPARSATRISVGESLAYA